MSGRGALPNLSTDPILPLLPSIPAGRRSSRGGNGEGFRDASQEGSAAAADYRDRRKRGRFAGDGSSSRTMSLIDRVAVLHPFFAFFKPPPFPPAPRVDLAVQSSDFRVGRERERCFAAGTWFWQRGAGRGRCPFFWCIFLFFFRWSGDLLW